MSVNALLHEKKFLHQILSTIKEEIFVVNEDMEIIYVNGPQKFGYNKESVLNQTIFTVFPQLKKENSTIVKVFETGNPVIGNICTYITSRGERKMSLTSTYPIKEDGKVIGVYEVAEDISGISKLSEDLIKNQLIQKKNDIFIKQKAEDSRFYTIDSMIGQSSSMKKLKERAVITANSPSNVFIYGETGTGKELLAQSIFSLGSNSKNAPFIAQNCAAIPESLLESLLFGTVKGSFTGAEDRQGLFELANGGVLFLDEINSMPKNLQAKILRVIQEGEVRRVGGKSEIPINIKLISSTNVKPEILLENGDIREDLYYRLNVLYLEIPPLRERREDIPYLVQSFIQEYNKKFNKQVIGVDEKTMDFFMGYDWPGNIRELKNIVERLFNVTNGKVIRFDETELSPYLALKQKDIPSPSPVSKKNGRVRLKEEIVELEIKIIKEALIETGANISKAARDLDIPQQTLNNKIDRYNLRPFIDSIRT